jgi:hypothetical protein
MDSRAVWFVTPIARIAATPRMMPRALNSMRKGLDFNERKANNRIRAIENTKL